MLKYQCKFIVDSCTVVIVENITVRKYTLKYLGGKSYNVCINLHWFGKKYTRTQSVHLSDETNRIKC